MEKLENHKRFDLRRRFEARHLTRLDAVREAWAHMFGDVNTFMSMHCITETKKRADLKMKSMLVMLSGA